MAWKRAILHVDMDAFYASVEQRDQPELRGKAIVVGGTGRRGVVTSPSYEARRFGVKSAMPMYAALKLCPHAIAVPLRMARYVEVSKQVMKVFGDFTPSVEPLSLDEAFLDITGTEALFGPPVDVGWKVQRAIRERIELSCSVGVAANKYVAKVASDLKKPAGLVVVPPGEERAFLEPLALERLWGVGPKTAEKLHAKGLVTIGDVARAALAEFGAVGEHIGALARGEDERPVDVDRREKSLGSERTLEFDVRGPERVRKEILALVDDVAAQLRARNVRAGGVRLKLKYADFRRVSRELTLAEPAYDAQTLLAAIDSLLPRVETDRPIRLVGIACTRLIEADAPRQPSLFAGDASEQPGAVTTSGPMATERHERLGRALDAIHAKYGDEAIGRAGRGPKHERMPRGE